MGSGLKKMNRGGFFISALVASCLLGNVATVRAQLIDTIGSMGIGGQMATQGVKATSQGMNALKQNQIIQNLNLLVMDIKMNHIGGYAGLNRTAVGGKNPFPGMDWSLGSDNGQTFYVEFNHIEASLCQKLTSPGLGALKIFINGVNSKTANCSNTSKIKIIYE